MLEDLKPHIADLRKRLVNIILTLTVAFFICFNFYDIILEWMMVPAKEALPANSHMVAMAIEETFFTAMQVSFFSGFVLSLPIVFWQIWMFLAPGLYEHEKKLIVPFVFFATLQFVMGALFAYYFVIPVGFSFLINFGSTVVTVLPSIGTYVDFFTKLIIGFGISFELPVIVFFFAKIGLVDDKMLKDFFRYAVVLIFIIAAVLTPPDVISQLLMAAPLLFLYGVSIWIAKIVNPAPKDEENLEDEE